MKSSPSSSPADASAPGAPSPVTLYEGETVLARCRGRCHVRDCCPRDCWAGADCCLARAYATAALSFVGKVPRYLPLNSARVEGDWRDGTGPHLSGSSAPRLARLRGGVAAHSPPRAPPPPPRPPPVPPPACRTRVARGRDASRTSTPRRARRCRACSPVADATCYMRRTAPRAARPPPPAPPPIRKDRSARWPGRGRQSV
eukprot:scaffold23032_cov52-Phaeocystis_antarctica.AAC.1